MLQESTGEMWLVAGSIARGKSATASEVMRAESLPDPCASGLDYALLDAVYPSASPYCPIQSGPKRKEPPHPPRR